MKLTLVLLTLGLWSTTFAYEDCSCNPVSYNNNADVALTKSCAAAVFGGHVWDYPNRPNNRVKMPSDINKVLQFKRCCEVREYFWCVNY